MGGVRVVQRIAVVSARVSAGIERVGNRNRRQIRTPGGGDCEVHRAMATSVQFDDLRLSCREFAIQKQAAVLFGNRDALDFQLSGRVVGNCDSCVARGNQFPGCGNGAADHCRGVDFDGARLCSQWFNGRCHHVNFAHRKRPVAFVAAQAFGDQFRLDASAFRGIEGDQPGVRRRIQIDVFGRVVQLRHQGRYSTAPCSE